MAAVADQKENDGCRWVWLRFSENPTSPFLVLKEVGSHRKSVSAQPHTPLLSFRLGDVKLVDEIGAKAKKKACLVEAAHQGGPMRGYLCLVSDPDGHLLEFACVPVPKPA